jgi:rSAM/selenodomain-associated transferase 2
MPSSVTLSVVIPALDAAATLPASLAALDEGRHSGLIGEILVVDGGSHDATPVVAAACGARVLTAPRGRGVQLAAGAAAATGGWLLFLHADTRLAAGWAERVAALIAASDAADRARYFRLVFDDAAPAARRLERIVGLRCRWLGLPYGDQGLLLSRHLYEAVGGYRPLPLMEDVDLVRRLGRRRLALLDWPATTSAQRYRRDGWHRRMLRNACCLGLYYAGVPPRLIGKLYG